MHETSMVPVQQKAVSQLQPPVIYDIRLQHEVTP